MSRVSTTGHAAQLLLLLAVAFLGVFARAHSCGGQGEAPCIISGQARCNEDFRPNANGNRCVPCNNGGGNPCPVFCGLDGEDCCASGAECIDGLTCSGDPLSCSAPPACGSAVGAVCCDVEPLCGESLLCDVDTSTCVGCGLEFAEVGTWDLMEDSCYSYYGDADTPETCEVECTERGRPLCTFIPPTACVGFREPVPGVCMPGQGEIEETPGATKWITCDPVLQGGG